MRDVRRRTATERGRQYGAAHGFRRLDGVDAGGDPVAPDRPDLVDLAGRRTLAVRGGGRRGASRSAEGRPPHRWVRRRPAAQAAIDAAAAYGLVGRARTDRRRRPRRLAGVGRAGAGRPVLDHTHAGSRHRRSAPARRCCGSTLGAPSARARTPPPGSCSTRLQDLVRPGDAVADIGCGSGVLAVGAARCGAAEVIAHRIDPEAPAVTHANAERNGVGRIGAASTDPAAAPGRIGPAVRGGRRQPARPGGRRARTPPRGAAWPPAGRSSCRGCWPTGGRHRCPALAPLQLQRVDLEDGWVAVVLAEPAQTGGRFARMAVPPTREIAFDEDDLSDVVAVLGRARGAGDRAGSTSFPRSRRATSRRREAWWSRCSRPEATPCPWPPGPRPRPRRPRHPRHRARLGPAGAGQARPLRRRPRAGLAQGRRSLRRGLVVTSPPRHRHRPRALVAAGGEPRAQHRPAHQHLAGAGVPALTDSGG